MTRLYIASLSDYNAGILHGVWVDMTDDDDTVNIAIADMLKASPTTRRTGEPAEEYAIHDYEGWGPYKVGEYESLDSLRELAQGIDTHGLAFAVYADNVGSIEEATISFGAAYVGDYDSLEDFATECVEEGLFGSMPEAIEPYIDYKAIARDFDYEGYWRDNKTGAIFRPV